MILFKWCKKCKKVTEWAVNKIPHTSDYGLEICKKCKSSSIRSV